jgi:hypothetical protein
MASSALPSPAALSPALLSPCKAAPDATASPTPAPRSVGSVEKRVDAIEELARRKWIDYYRDVGDEKHAIQLVTSQGELDEIRQPKGEQKGALDSKEFERLEQARKDWLRYYTQVGDYARALELVVSSDELSELKLAQVEAVAEIASQPAPRPAAGRNVESRVAERSVTPPLIEVEAAPVEVSPAEVSPAEAVALQAAAIEPEPVKAAPVKTAPAKPPPVKLPPVSAGTWSSPPLANAAAMGRARLKPVQSPNGAPLQWSPKGSPIANGSPKAPLQWAPATASPKAPLQWSPTKGSPKENGAHAANFARTVDDSLEVTAACFSPTAGGAPAAASHQEALSQKQFRGNSSRMQMLEDARIEWMRFYAHAGDFDKAIELAVSRQEIAKLRADRAAMEETGRKPPSTQQAATSMQRMMRGFSAREKLLEI